MWNDEYRMWNDEYRMWNFKIFRFEILSFTFFIHNSFSYSNFARIKGFSLDFSEEFKGGKSTNDFFVDLPQ
jgi:hypothetical protein